MALCPVSRCRPALILLTAALACGPKSDGNDEGAGDETNSGTTTTGEALSSGGSDPTAPTASGTAGSATAGSATTTSADSGEDPTATATATSAGTSVTTANDTGDDTGDEPPVIPCEGESTPLAGITTTIGYLQSQVPPRPDTTGTGGSSSGGGELDPGTLFIKLSDQNFTCAEPNALLTCGPHWSVTIVIPPEFQSPGTYNLLGQDVHGSAFETGDDGGQDCSFGGGSFDATFQIFSVDDNTVEGRLCHVNAFFSAPVPSLEGSFSAPRCQ